VHAAGVMLLDDKNTPFSLLLLGRCAAKGLGGTIGTAFATIFLERHLTFSGTWLNDLPGD
jgi:hypothetical protein